MTAGIIAERVSGQSWEEFTRERLLRPLGMENANFQIEGMQQTDEAARPYIIVEEDRRRSAYWPIRPTAAGGINASIAEMAKYLRFQLDGGKFEGQQLLSAANVRAMRTPQILESLSEFEEFGDAHYGFGIGSRHYRGTRWLGHSGGWIGWNSLISIFPEKRIGVMVLTNSPNPASRILTFGAFDRLCGLDEIDWLGRFHERKQQFLAQQKLDKAARIAARRPDTRPTRKFVASPL